MSTNEGAPLWSVKPEAITALMTELTEPQRKIRQSSPDKAEFNSRGWYSHTDMSGSAGIGTVIRFFMSKPSPSVLEAGVIKLSYKSLISFNRD